MHNSDVFMLKIWHLMISEADTNCTDIRQCSW